MGVYRFFCFLIVGSAFVKGHVIERREASIPSIQLEYGVPSSLTNVDLKSNKAPETRLPVSWKPDVDTSPLPEKFEVPEINLPSFINKHPAPLGLPYPTVSKTVLPPGLPDLPAAPVLPEHPTIDEPEQESETYLYEPVIHQEYGVPVEQINKPLPVGLPDLPAAPVINVLPSVDEPEYEIITKAPIAIPEAHVPIPHQVYGVPVNENRKPLPAGLPDLPAAPVIPVLPAVDIPKQEPITEAPIVIPEAHVPIPHQVYGVPVKANQQSLPAGLPELPAAPVIPVLPTVDVPEYEPITKAPIVIPEAHVPIPHQVYGVPVNENHKPLPAGLPDLPAAPVIPELHTVDEPEYEPIPEAPISIPEAHAPIPHEVYGVPVNENHTPLPAGLPDLPAAPIIPEVPKTEVPNHITIAPIVVPEVHQHLPIPHQAYGVPDEVKHPELPSSSKPIITDLPSLPPPPVIITIPHQVYGVPITQTSTVYSPSITSNLGETSSSSLTVNAGKPEKNEIFNVNVIQKLIEKKMNLLPKPTLIHEVSQIHKQLGNHHQAVVKQLQLTHQEIVKLLTPTAEAPTVDEAIVATPNIQLVPYSVSVPAPTPNVAVQPNYHHQPLIYTPHTVYGVPLNGPLFSFN